MRTIRRLYFYAVSIVSIQIVLWGLISLMRETFSPETIGGGAERLARALSLILVGVPVFAFHWWTAQKHARQDDEEHSSGVRAVFLYGILLATLIPVVQNGLALLNRAFLSIFQISVQHAMIGGEQSLIDNLIGILLNILVAVYFLMVLRDDWRKIQLTETFADVRRFYRYLWVIYGLLMVVAGVHQLITFITYAKPSQGLFISLRETLPNGLALLLLGLPLWIYAWKSVQKTLTEIQEQDSLLRLGFLYALTLVAVAVVLGSGGSLVNTLLVSLFGGWRDFATFLGEIRGALAIGVPMAGVWLYYGYWFKEDMAQVRETTRRAGMRRLYNYILSLIGLTATVIGLSMLLSFVIDLALGDVFWGAELSERLSAALATLLVSLPLWVLSWRPMQAEAMLRTDEGDHARRSLVRKAFLYLVLFALVIGSMISAGSILFTVLSALLADLPSDFVSNLLNITQLFILFVIFLLYHWQTLRRDGIEMASALATQHGKYPVMVFDMQDNGLTQTLLKEFNKQLPQLPVQVQPISEGIPPEALEEIKAVVLPADLAVAPPEALRVWLAQFNGSKVIVPRSTQRWYWAGWAVRSQQSAAKLAADMLRQMAEGQDVQVKGSASAWTIVVYILGALFGLQLLVAIFSILVSTIFD